MQQKLDQVLRLSRELVYDHGMKQNVIYKTITQHLKESSKRTEYVLYNDCYGGFSYSDQYIIYTKVRHGSKREGCRDNIIAFGKMLCEKYPRISNMLSVYHKDGMEEQTDKCVEYKHLLKQTKMMETNLRNISNMSRDTRISYSDTILGLVFSCMYSVKKFQEDGNGKYTIGELVDALQEKIHENRLEMEEMYPTLNLQLLDVLDILNSTNTKSKTKSFLSAVEEFGELDHGIWDCQSHLCSKSMKCILKMGSTSTQEPDDMVYESFGLLGASGRYSCLKFAEVPAELEWTITEYDGLETINVA